MNTMHRASPGAKAFAYIFGQDAARALEALTGRAPTLEQLAAMGETARSKVVRYPTRPTPAPNARALTFHRAGRLVADAALLPRRTVRFLDPCDTFEAIETHRDKLTRCAGILISGCAAESYATGSNIHHQAAVSIAAFSALMLSNGRIDDLHHAVMDFEDCASLALRHAWPVIEAVEARLHAEQSADDILIRARAPANAIQPPHLPIRAALDYHLRSVGETVAALTIKLNKLGGRAR